MFMDMSEGPDIVGSWIGARLTGQWGEVGSVVPSGYEAYIRILHPVSVGEAETVRWCDVAAVTGQPVHSLVQWTTIAGLSDASAPSWTGDEPLVGELDARSMAALMGVLLPHTRTPDEGFFGIWDGYVEFHEEETVVWGGTDGESAHIVGMSAVAAQLTHGGRLRCPGRNYVLLQGPLREASAIRSLPGEGELELPAPNVIWPQDHSWFIASEIDFDSTLVGCTRSAANDILVSGLFEAFEVAPGDSLANDVSAAVDVSESL